MLMTPPPVATGSGLSALIQTVAKNGRTPDENEDSAATDASAGLFAIADGAATSARPEVWSRLLVESFVGERLNPLAPQALARLRGQWRTAVMRDGLAWYAEAKLAEGAAATFLGLRVEPATRSFHAIAVGDSCLFHLRHHSLLSVGPIQRAADFGRFPDLVSSRPDIRPAPATDMCGTYRVGDVFLLATDAMAEFLLAAYERYGLLPIGHLLDARFQRRVVAYRDRGRIGNDDTTVCAVRT